jgi:hypothetical protein
MQPHAIDALRTAQPDEGSVRLELRCLQLGDPMLGVSPTIRP